MMQRSCWLNSAMHDVEPCCLDGWLADLEAQLGDEVLSFRYFVQRPKELFWLPAPKEGR